MKLKFKYFWDRFLDNKLQNGALILFLMAIFGVCFQGLISVAAQNFSPDQANLLKSWKEILLILAAGLLIFDISLKKQWLKILKLKITWLFLMMIFLNILYVVIYRNPTPNEQAGILINLRLYGAFLIGFLCCYRRPFAKILVIWAVFLGILANILFGLLQISVLPVNFLENFGYSEKTILPYLTVDLNHDFIRIFGFLRGPNPFGVLMMLGFILFLALALTVYKTKSKHKLEKNQIYKLLVLAGLMLLALILVWHSYSRSALIGLFVALGVFGALILIDSWQKFLKIGSVCLVIFALAGGLIFVNRNSNFVQNVLFHTNNHGGSEIKSDQKRKILFDQQLEEVAKNPAGYGVGSTGSASIVKNQNGKIIENQYLAIAHEIGWFGLLLYLMIFGFLLYFLAVEYLQKRNYMALAVFSAGIACLVVGFVLPVWVDDTVAILWWGLAGIFCDGKLDYLKTGKVDVNHIK